MRLSKIHRFIISAVNTNKDISFTIKAYLLLKQETPSHFILAVNSDSDVEYAPFFLKNLNEAMRIISYLEQAYSLGKTKVEVLNSADFKIA